MALARDIVRYARHSSVDPFSLDAAARLRADPAAAILLNQCSEAADRVLLTMQALAIQRGESAERPTAEFVATVPAGADITARPTAVVVREMLAGPHSRIVALGYEISDLGVIARLHEAALQCPDIVLLCDRDRQSARRLLESWPTDRHRPKVYQNIAWPGAAPMASMHCKALLVNSTDLLVTSANFTYHGMRGNIEFGLRLRGPLVTPAHGIFLQLLMSGLFELVSLGDRQGTHASQLH